MSDSDHLDATWTEGARTDVERFIVNSRVPGAVLSLFKSADEPEGARWSYSVLIPERIQALQAALASHQYRLLYDVDGVCVAISNSKHAQDLNGKVLDHGGPGYLIARPISPS
jgi:hypothetical protein